MCSLLHSDAQAPRGFGRSFGATYWPRGRKRCGGRAVRRGEMVGDGEVGFLEGLSGAVKSPPLQFSAVFPSSGTTAGYVQF